MKVKQLAKLVSLLCIAGPTAAQTTPPTPATPQKVEKIEITGSSIKRVQSETALPLQVITKEEIDKAGIVSAEQLVTLISANGNGADNLSSNMGVINSGPTFRNNFGNASANIRGIGSSSTLVLLNSRRVSLHGAKGFSVDLSSIPLAAIERVEVLKDGASAVYGTDAVGGVINFITKKEYKGAQITGFADVTHDGGGNIYRGSLLAGTGDLAKNRFNAFLSLTVDRQEKLDPEKRDFVNGYQPARGLTPDTVGGPWATLRGAAGSALTASFTTPQSGATLLNRANLLSFQNRCSDGFQMQQYDFTLWNAPSFRFACSYDYGGQQLLMQEVDRANAVGRANWAISDNHTVIAEVTGYKTTARRAFEYSQITTAVGTNAYPVNGPFYQNLQQFIPSFNPNLPLVYSWRCVSCGKRTIDTDTKSYRALLALEGVLGRFDYKLGYSQGNSRADSVLKDGYMKNTEFNNLLASGIINIFLLPGQGQTPQTQALIDAAKATGRKLFGGEATLRQFDGGISGEFWQLPGGPIGVAAGFDVRKESYKFSDGSTTEAVRDAPFDATFPKVSRDIKAIYAEAALPLHKTFEVSVAVRRDDYSDFGDTVNPKFSFKWNPTQSLLFRGSYNRGFRAPSFFQLYGAVTEAIVPGNLADPELCPLTPNDPAVCAIRPLARQGGNPALGPERSKQFSGGIVFAPTDWFTANLDLWELRRKDVIFQLTPQQVVANYTTFPENLVRGTDGRLNGPGGYIRAGFVNADGDILKGMEVGVQVNTRVGDGKLKAEVNGTYMKSAKTRIFSNQVYTEQVGKHTFPNLYIRWKHVASGTYTEGPWAVTLTQQYTGGYQDERPPNPPPTFNPDVDSYILYNVSVGYTGFKNVTIRGGIKNIFNTDPPFTAHNVDFSPGTGWEARVGDPRGRAYTLSATYTFK
ncbi:MAG: TonB-dependent receptor [Betaproteobacteria bacterium]|nr:TonB-dependent receptor [Betaproteobacteria bacterium]